VPAAQYAQHRPDYAAAAIRWCLGPVSGAQPVRVADVGAGTGILTSALAGLGADVVAVEPDQDMLAELTVQRGCCCRTRASRAASPGAGRLIIWSLPDRRGHRPARDLGRR
jgi:SAM-dependent methyltransferase